MKVRTIKFIFILISVLFTSPSAAQQLKPTEIIYSRLPNNLNAPPRDANQPSIWAVGQDGANDRFITFGTLPRISDDGRFLLFKRFTRHPSYYNPFGGYADFYIRELATGQETLILAHNFDQGSYGHFFSPESNQGSFEIIADDTCFLYKFNRDGTNVFRFPWANAPYCADDAPVVRRGGDQLIAFHNLSDAANGGLYTVGISGANRQKIPNTNCRDIIPAWSNDNQFLAYGLSYSPCATLPLEVYPYYVSDIFKIKPDGTAKQQLTSLTNNNCSQTNSNCFTFGIVWTEDNSKIIAAGRISGTAGLFSIPADGGVINQIPISAGNAPEFVGGIVQPRVERNVVSIGGGVTSNGNYTLVSTIGEAVAGLTSQGGSYTFESGFWAISAEIRRAIFDFDGDGRTEIGIFRPAPGEWWYLRSSDGGNRAFQFGSNSDRIIPADYTGDGKTDVAIFRPAEGNWYILRSEDSSFYAFPFGVSTDIPAPGDYDGDGRTDAAVFRPSNATWYIQRSSGGISIRQFGANGDAPVVGDYDNDGKSDIAIFRPNGAGGAEWWIERSAAGLFAVQFGASGDKAVAGDYTGDGKADIAVFRPSTGEWFVLRSEDSSYYAFPFGAAGDVPAPGDYDGDGKFDAAIFRPSNAIWYIQRSSSGVQIQQFGASGDRPIPNAFVP